MRGDPLDLGQALGTDSSRNGIERMFVSASRDFRQVATGGRSLGRGAAEKVAQDVQVSQLRFARLRSISTDEHALVDDVAEAVDDPSPVEVEPRLVPSCWSE